MTRTGGSITRVIYRVSNGHVIGLGRTIESYEILLVAPLCGLKKKGWVEARGSCHPASPRIDNM